ncbi:MAG: TonB-dependent receptor domain-containing protein, partial [Myxococcota bacterium]
MFLVFLAVPSVFAEDGTLPAPEAGPAPTAAAPVSVPPDAVPTAPAAAAPATVAATAPLAGTVLDEMGLGVPGAVVTVGALTATTDPDGNFRLDAPVGSLEVTVVRAGFDPAASTIDLPAEGASLAITLVLASASVGDELTIQSSASPGGTIELLRARKEAAAVVDVVGSEQMSRTGDTDAAAALKRVNGLTVLGGKYVYVRGLGDRYSQTLLDGASLPSPEPEKRVVPLDLFPSSLLESVVVQKTFSPDVPAEFGGGVVSIRTRRAPEEPIFSLTLSGGWAGGTTLREAQVGPSGPTDAFGFGTAWRALPEEVAAASAEAPLKAGGIFAEDGYTPEDLERFGEALPNRWGTETRVLPPDLGLTLQAGRSWNAGPWTLGALGGIVFSNAWSLDEGWKIVYADTAAGLEAKRRTDFVEAKNEIRLGGMLSVALEHEGGATVRSTTLLNRNSAATTLRYDADDPTGSNDTRSAQLRWEEQQLFFEQVEASAPFGPVRVDGRYALSVATQAEPDRREYTYLATDAGYVLSQRGSWSDVYYTDLLDTGHDVGLDLTWTLPRRAGDARLAAGGKAFVRERTSGVRRFGFEFVGSEGIDLTAPIEDILVPENIGAEAPGDAGYVQLEENTTSADDYRATQDLFAGYVLADVPWTKRVRTLVGARVEASDQRVETYELFSADGAPIVGDLATVDVLPAATVTFGLGPSELPDGMQVRLGYGRTLSRPELRELSEVPYYDYRSGRLLYGNPELSRATIDNVDLRWEWYPSAGESVSVAGFFKYFDDPIESVVAVSAVSGSVGTFANADSATNLGGEIDLRKRLDVVHPALHDLYVSGNVSVIR